MRGYKVFSPDFTCRGMQFEENKTFEVPLPISICSHGLHFCIKASHCFSYYDFDPKNIVCEVEALGEIQLHNGDSKVCTNMLRVGRRLSWQEVLVVANDGKNNTGYSNSGDCNSGNRNSGAFCIDNNPKLILFDKLTDINVRDWEESEPMQIMRDLLELTIWVNSSNMTAKEKELYPQHESTGGYLKVKTLHQAWADMWGKLDDEKKKLFTSLQNFDKDKFKIITGIDV